MNFFKKVMTFFSTIWNAILWRRSDKKTKRAPKGANEEDHADIESNPEGEKLFVDVPLNSTEASETTEQDILINDEITADCTPAVTHNIETQATVDNALKNHSSSVHLLGFGEETSRSLSFFSEPVVKNEELEVAAVPILEDGQCKLKAEEDVVSSETVTIEARPVQLLELEGASSSFLETTQDANEPATGLAYEDGNLEPVDNEDAIPETASPEPENSSTDITLVDEQGFDGIVSQKVPKPPTEPILGNQEVAELTPPVLDGESVCGIRSLSSLTETSLVHEEVPLGIFPSIENLTCSSTDRNMIPPAYKINPDLNILATGGEMHLFDHGTDDVPQIEEEGDELNETSKELKDDQPADPFTINPDLKYLAIGDEVHPFERGTDNMVKMRGTSQVVKNDQSAENDSSMHVLKSANAEPEWYDVERSMVTSRTLDIQIGVSVSATGSPHAKEEGTDSCSKYSTNYMVKSDSLVNFLPEGGSILDVSDVADLPPKTMRMNEKEETPDHFSNAVLKEGGLEEIMCTSRGVLKLSGDHHVDCTDASISQRFEVFDDSHLIHGLKAVADDPAMDTFLFEEPLLPPSHLEGSILEETVITSNTVEDTPIFHPQDILKTIDIGKDDARPGKDSDNYKYLRSDLRRSRLMTHEVGQSREFKFGNESKPSSPDHGSDEGDEEERRSPCKLRQFSAFHLDNNPSPAAAQLKIQELPLPQPSTVKYGEITAIPGIPGVVAGKDTGPSSQEVEHGSTSRFMTEFQQSDFFKSLDWQVSLPSIDETSNMNEPSPMIDSHINSGHPDLENMNDNHPFIDCSSCLMRIPEEIRNDNGFNPCVGAAPARRSNYTNHNNFQPTRFDGGNDTFDKKYTKLNAMAPSYVGVPLINSCIPEEYHDSGLPKLPAGYNHRAENLGTFWETHPGSGNHGDQQQAAVGYPVSYHNDFYDSENSAVMAAAVYENDQANLGVNTEVYTYPYGEIEFPILGIPLCPPQLPPAFIPRPTMPPLVFPLNVNENQVPSQVGVTAQSDQYSNTHFGRCPPPGFIQHDDEEPREISQVGKVRSLTPVENMSFAGPIDENEDDFDNPISDPYVLAGNNSLHTVKSKADSYSGSLFCESLRSLISHNTDENIFPSFSCSSVQGYCPSIVLQSRGTTLSNDSLPSIIVEENNYSKSVDEDYLATEKFMNDVNTALNESVLDQIQARNDMRSNLLGRGDGSMSVNLDQSGVEEQSENDVMLRNSLGENISINNSKLTLLDGILGTDNGGSPPPEFRELRENTSEEYGESSISAHVHCRQVLDSLIDSVLEAAVDHSSLEGSSELQETNTNQNVDDTVPKTDRDLVVQSMMFIEGMPDELRKMWRPRPKQDDLDKDKKVACSEEAGVSKLVSEKILRESGDIVLEDPQDPVPAEGSPRSRGRRNRKRMKKPTNVDPEATPGVATGDGVSMLQDQPALVKTVEELHAPLEPRQMQSSMPNSEPERSLAIVENPQEAIDEVVEHEEDEDIEQSGNSSNNRRRRNRRRRRRN